MKKDHPERCAYCHKPYDFNPGWMHELIPIGGKGKQTYREVWFCGMACHAKYMSGK